MITKGLLVQQDATYSYLMTNTAETTAPLASLDEEIVHDGATWFAEGPRGALWVIRWFSDSGNIAGMTCPGARVRYRSEASGLDAARSEARRIAGLIAAGKKG